MYGDQSGEFECGFLGLKALSQLQIYDTDILLRFTQEHIDLWINNI